LGDTALTYDASGNITSTGDGCEFTWEGGNRLESASADGGSISYSYDVNGYRTSKTVTIGENTITTKYTTVDGRITRQQTGNDNMYFFYDESGQLVSLNYQGTNYFYVKNLQGDIIAITDVDGNIKVEYTYDAWGQPTSATGSMASTLGAANPFLYRGYYFEPEFNLYYLQSRYYSPVAGRFLNADSMEQVNGSNLFVYCGNNPVNCVDPTGEKYSVNDALAYAARYWQNYNPDFPVHNNDCASFVSQCLNAGGWWRTINWFYLRVEDIPILWNIYLLPIDIILVTIGNQKIKITDSWGTADGLKNYLKNNREITPMEFTDQSSFNNAVEKGIVKLGAVVIMSYRYNCFDEGKQRFAGEGKHAVMIGRIDKKNGAAYYYAHDNSKNAMNNNSNVDNLITSKYIIYVFNIS